MSDENKESSHPEGLMSWIQGKGPGAMAFVGLITAMTGWINAEIAKSQVSTVQSETEQIESSARSFENTLAQTREHDEAVINEVLERCYENDRLLRYYASTIESRLYTLMASSSEEEMEYTPAEFPSPADITNANIEEKLEELYSDDEVRELIRLIELSRQFEGEE